MPAGPRVLSAVHTSETTKPHSKASSPGACLVHLFGDLLTCPSAQAPDSGPQCCRALHVYLVCCRADTLSSAVTTFLCLQLSVRRHEPEQVTQPSAA